MISVGLRFTGVSDNVATALSEPKAQRELKNQFGLGGAVIFVSDQVAVQEKKPGLFQLLAREQDPGEVEVSVDDVVISESCETHVDFDEHGCCLDISSEGGKNVTIFIGDKDATTFARAMMQFVGALNRFGGRFPWMSDDLGLRDPE